MSILLALLGAGSFVLGLGLSFARQPLRASRSRSYALRAGLAFLLLLGARLHYQRALADQLDTRPLAGRCLVLRLVGLHPLSAGEASYDLASPDGGRLLLRLRHPSLASLEVGDEVEIEGARWKAINSFLAERPAVGRSLLAGGYTALATGGTMRLRRVADSQLLFHPALLALRLRGRLLARLDGLALRPTTKLLLSGLTLGALPKDEAGQALRQTFVRGGVAHLLAVSGFHLALVVALLVGLLRRLPGLRGRLHLRWGLTLLGAWAFALLSGASIPTLRAVAMLSLYAGAKCLGRRASFPEILAIPALIQLVLHPTSLWGASFLLTYGAMVGIYLFFRPLRAGLGSQGASLGRYFADSLALTGAVLPFVLPLSLYLFGRVSLAFPWTTLIALPLASLLILFGGLLFLLLGLGIAPPSFYLQLLDAVASWLEAGVRWAEGIPWLQVQASLSPEGLGLYFALLLLFLLVLRSRQG